MQVNNSLNDYNNVSFRALPGGKIRALLINNPEKYQQIKSQLAPLGDANTVVDIFTGTKQFAKDKIYSLRIYNKVFGSGYNVPIDKNNIEYMPAKLIPKVESLTNKDIQWGEYSLFKSIKDFYSGQSFRYKEYLANIMRCSKEQGIELGPAAKKTFEDIA